MSVIKIRSLGLGSHVNDNDPEVLQKEKERSLKDKRPTVIKEFPGWNPLLASDSEQIVKAEQTGFNSTEELQDHTTRLIMEFHHEEMIMEDSRGSGFRGNQAEKPDLQQNLEHSANQQQTRR